VIHSAVSLLCVSRILSLKSRVGLIKSYSIVRCFFFISWYTSWRIWS